MRLNKAVSLLTIVGLGFALSVAAMERRASTASSGPQVAGLAVKMAAKSAFSAVIGTAIGGAPSSLVNTREKVHQRTGAKMHQ